MDGKRSRTRQITFWTVIVLIVIVNKFLPLSKIGMQLTVAAVTLISFAGVLGEQFHITRISDIINSLPFAQASLPWLVPALVGILLSLFLPNKQKSERFEMES